MGHQPSLIGKADVATIAYNEMVQDPNPEHIARRHESCCQDTILLTRRGIATGMIVEKNHGCGGFPHGETEHFTGMNNAECQAAFRHGRIPHDRVLRVQEDNLENLMAEISETGVVVMKEITARRDLRAFGQWCSERTLAEFERGFQLGRFRRSDSRNGTEFLDSAMSEARKTVKTV
jgi:hypothetical protein